MSRVLCTDPLPQMFVDMAQALLPADVDFAAVPTLDEQDFARLAVDAEVLLVVHRQIGARLLSLAPQLRLIQRSGIGYENIDVDAAIAAGIPVAYTPGANARAVAEHAILLMLALVKRFVAAEQATRAGGWPMMEFAQTGIGDLDGATVGLVGFGHTGRAVAERLRPFGARIVYHTRHRLASAVETKYQATYLSLPELLATSQIVSLHTPLTPATQHLFDDEQLARMQQGAYLVNVARGGLIDEPALRRAIERGHLAGAGLDTVEREEEGGNPFVDLPQVLVTPHTAGPSRRGIDALLQRSFDNINRVLAGEPPQDLVPEMVQS
jgi:phosphoglycerate dehydrogenase-like enzyme